MKAINFSLRSLLMTALLLGIVMALPACVGYRVGSMLPPKYKTVAVPTFVNRTEEPFLQDETTSATISEIQMDGSLKIADMDNADTILTVVLTDFQLRPIRYSDNRARLAQEYRLYITASLILKDRVTDEVVVESPAVQGYSDFLVSGDLSSSKQAAFPDAAEDLAHKIVEKVVEVW